MDSREQYGFPTLDAASIAAHLSEFGIQAVTAQIARPTSDVVINLYSQCLSYMTGITHDSLHEPVQDAIVSLNCQDPDMYAQGLAHNLLTHHIGRLAISAKIGDYTTRDLIFPDPVRTRIILSGLINYIAHVQSVQGTVDRIRSEAFALRGDRDKAAQKLAKAQHDLDTAKAQQAADQPKCDEIAIAHDEKARQIYAFKDMGNRLNAEVAQMKAERAQISERKAQLNHEIGLQQDEITRLQARLVRSPERIRRNITTMGTSVAEDKRTIATHEARVRDLQAKVGALRTIERDVRACVEQLQAVQVAAQELETAEKQLADLRDQQEGREHEKQGLGLKQERIMQQLSNAKEKLDRAKRQSQEKRAATQATLEQLEREWEAMVVARADNDREVEELRKEAEEIEVKMAEHMRVSDAELNDLLSAYWSLRRQTETYMDALGSKLNFKIHND